MGLINHSSSDGVIVDYDLAQRKSMNTWLDTASRSHDWGFSCSRRLSTTELLATLSYRLGFQIGLSSRGPYPQACCMNWRAFTLVLNWNEKYCPF